MAGSVGYFETFVRIGKSAVAEWRVRGPRSSFLQEFFEQVSLHGRISSKDISMMLFIGLAFTILRFCLTTTIFKPLAQWFQFIKKDAKKFPESAFKLICYLGAHIYCVYVLFNGKYNFFDDLSSHWIGWHEGMHVPNDIYLLYILQAGFYFHSLFATFFMDEWRRDSVTMVLHHILANLLIVFSLASRYHRIGMLVLLLHDLCDVLLEFTKICTCMKQRGGKYHRTPDILATVGFLLFATAWFVCRLYLYPIKVLYSAGHVARVMIPDGPFYFFFNTMLWALFLMNIWWFHFIVWLIIRVARGDTREVEDVREIPDSGEPPSKRIANGHVHKNGSVQSNGKSKGVHNGEEKEANGNIINGKEKNGQPQNMRQRKM